MPSFPHEILVLLFKNRPALAPELLRDALHVGLPAYSEVRIDSADLSDVVPTEYRADLVVLLVDGKPVFSIVVEVQLRPDDRKRFTWPMYVAALRARLSCPACLLVLTPSETVADWCRAPIELGPRGMFAREPGAEVIASAALNAVRSLEREWRVVYSDLIYGALSAAAKDALEELVELKDYIFQSEFALTHQAKGREEGRREGREEARATTLADSVFAVLEARRLPISDEQRARIRACTNVAQLDEWLRKAASAVSADEVF